MNGLNIILMRKYKNLNYFDKNFSPIYNRFHKQQSIYQLRDRSKCRPPSKFQWNEVLGK
ncbi:hypothetical protein A3Q56_06071 [Intoshia linei]|uniref:Uncharacterized protein n=1 Tax=Intoshia linei TaxID=1819745 RepID=A0A177AW36_9BILA|nr:hypothetical protein A3Q56_06071 [Intoshia linei]